MTVLKRYAEILKLKLPMKKFDNIKEIRCENVNIPLFTDIVHEAQSLYGKLREPFMWNREKIPSRKHELTATFSRDKESIRCGSVGFFHSVDSIQNHRIHFETETDHRRF